MGFPKNSRTTILRLIELKLYIFKSRPVQNLISQCDHRSCKQDQILRIQRIIFFEKKVLLSIIFYHGIRYYSLLPLHRCKNHVFTTNLARDMKFCNFFFSHDVMSRVLCYKEKRVSVKRGPDGCGWRMGKCGWKNADDKIKLKINKLKK